MRFIVPTDVVLGLWVRYKASTNVTFSINNVLFKLLLLLLVVWPSGPKRDCYARGLGFDSQVEQKVMVCLCL